MYGIVIIGPVMVCSFDHSLAISLAVSVSKFRLSRMMSFTIAVGMSSNSAKIVMTNTLSVTDWLSPCLKFSNLDFCSMFYVFKSTLNFKVKR